ncbi:MAG: four helix bundle protein [Candidatus Peribacteraceae bacterium]|nr:four helix bundle protein [Candidatus Peribacteraceae bacterium]
MSNQRSESREQRAESSKKHAPFKQLLIWDKAVQLAKLTYKLTETFPETEKFGLVSQMRRSAVSVPSNIAEGSQRTTKKDFANFLLIAKGSLAELETQQVISYGLGYLKEKDSDMLELQIDELAKMLYSFHAKLTSGL